MSVDKTWITLRNRLSDEYWNGVMAFVQRAKNFVNEVGAVRCPCRKCVNVLYQRLETMEAHIIDNGFDPNYTTWVHHGEQHASSSEPMFGSTSFNADEMIEIIHDFIGNPITGPIHENEDDEGGLAVGPDTIDGQMCEELFAEVEVELYLGCTSFSSLNFLVKLMHLKVMHKWTNKSFDALLKLLKEALPEGNKLPGSHYNAKKWLSKLGLGYESIHACKYDCALFWKEYAAWEECPVCGESRWIDKNTKGKKVPHKVLRYFPLTPRLRRLYGSRHTAKYMTWHQTGQSNEDGVMRHPIDGEAWQDFNRRHPNFSKEPRNVRLGLSANGFNPFADNSLSYSIWPVVLTTYNLPPWLCMKDSFFMLTLLIPGPQSPGKDIDVYLKPLVDELKLLWNTGVQIWDSATNNLFNMRAALLWTINDFPARSSLSGWSGQGYKACPTCNEDTPSM